MTNFIMTAVLGIRCANCKKHICGLFMGSKADRDKVAEVLEVTGTFSLCSRPDDTIIER
jgi:hypothetical protein